MSALMIWGREKTVNFLLHIVLGLGIVLRMKQKGVNSGIIHVLYEDIMRHGKGITSNWWMAVRNKASLKAWVTLAQFNLII